MDQTKSRENFFGSCGNRAGDATQILILSSSVNLWQCFSL